MIIPAMRLIFLLCFVKKLIIDWLQFTERREKAKSGKPRPIPNTKKFSMLEVKSPIRAARVRKAAMKAGLQGITIAPKKKP